MTKQENSKHWQNPTLPTPNTLTTQKHLDHQKTPCLIVIKICTGDYVIKSMATIIVQNFIQIRWGFHFRACATCTV